MRKPGWRMLLAPATTPVGIAILAVAALAPPLAAQITAQQRAQGWHMLFDGKSFAGWRGLGYDSVPSAHWKVVDGAIMKVASGSVPKLADGQPAAGGDLM